MVDATPSDISLLSKVVLYEARETVWASTKEKSSGSSCKLGSVIVRKPESAHVSQCLLFLTIWLQVLVYDLYVRPCHAWRRPCREYFAEFGFLLILPLVGTGCNCQKLRAIPKCRTTSCSSGRVRIHDIMGGPPNSLRAFYLKVRCLAS
jgi:hypothetical protein